MDTVLAAERLLFLGVIVGRQYLRYDLPIDIASVPERGVGLCHGIFPRLLRVSNSGGDFLQASQSVDPGVADRHRSLKRARPDAHFDGVARSDAQDSERRHVGETQPLRGLRAEREWDEGAAFSPILAPVQDAQTERGSLWSASGLRADRRWDS